MRTLEGEESRREKEEGQKGVSGQGSSGGDVGRPDAEEEGRQ